MFKFKRKQKIFEIGGVKIGGQPGQLPTVMMGSIFYHKHKIIKDEKTGLFDREKAEELLNKEEESSALTGNPRVIDIVASWPEAMERYITFIADHTSSPFLIDGVNAEVRIAGAKYVNEVGLTHRTIYNSINYATKPEEIAAILDTGLKSAIFLAFNPRKPTMEGRIEIFKGTSETRGLLQIADSANIEKLLIDASIIDRQDPGVGSKFIHWIKKEFGLPAGCGAHNAVHILKTHKQLDPLAYLTSNIVAQIIPIVMGANFALYGPIEMAPKLYPAIALTDAYVAYCMRQQFKLKPLTREHPLFKVFR